MKIDYPIAVDNDYAVWRAFGNHYWPALYFIDTQGRMIEKAILAGYDWGARTANIIAALWSERCKAIVEVDGY
jgi:hypothetical protein